MRRPRIPDELAGEVDRWRRNLPFETAVRELLKIGLAAQREAAETVERALQPERPRSEAQAPRKVPSVSETWRR